MRTALLIAIILAMAPRPLLRAQTPTRDPAIIAQAVDSLARQAVEAGLGPALGVAVVLDGQVILTAAHGMTDVSAGIRADDRTLWYLASTSKAITGVAISLLAEMGTVRFEDPITRLLPRARWHPATDTASLTLGDFLAHTHGLSSGAVVMQAAFVGQVSENRWPELLQWSEPIGDRTLRYSNLGYNVATMVLDVLRPEGWREFVRQRLFLPIGMQDTHARVSGLDSRRIARPHTQHADGSLTTATFFKVDATMNSAGGHLSTLRDLARWTIVQMDSGRIEGRQVIPAKAVARAQHLLARHEREQSRRFAWFDRDGWGAGWDIGGYQGERMVGRFGSYHSTRSHLSFLPEHRVGVIAMSNGDAGFRVPDILAALAYDLVLGIPDARDRATARLDAAIAARATALQRIAASDSVRAARQTVPLTRPLGDYAGTFVHPGYGSIEVASEGGTLAWRYGALYGSAEVFDATQDQWRIEAAGRGTVLQYRFDAAGRAETITVFGAKFTRRD